MRVGLYTNRLSPTVEDAVEQARRAAAAGFDAAWYPQLTGLDALTAIAVAAREVRDLHFGTAVVPVQGRHPLPLAMQALTVADVAGPGRFTLGLGVTHPALSENWFGVPYRGIVGYCAEVLDALDGLVSGERRADVDGEHVRTRASITLDTPPPSVMLAALGPRMVDLAGRRSDGTIAWMTGPQVLGRDITPRLRDAAAAAGRGEPRVVVGIPVCVTDDVAGGRSRLAPQMERSATMPSYRRQVEAEGVEHPVDLAVVGDEAAVAEGLDAFVRAGMTELYANVIGTREERQRTREFLAACSLRDG